MSCTIRTGRCPLCTTSMYQILFHLPSKPWGAAQGPSDTDGETKAQRGEGICPRSNQSPTMRAPSSPPGRATQPGVQPSDHMGLGVSGCGALPPRPAQQFFHLWEGWGLGVQAVPLPPLLSGSWPFKAAGCQGLSRGDPKGRVWSGTRGPFSTAAASGQPAGWGGRLGGDDKGRERLGIGRAETDWERNRETEGETAGLGCTQPPQFSQAEGWRLTQPSRQASTPKGTP